MSGVPESDAAFGDLFVRVLTSAGFPIIKYGRGKTVRRTLKLTKDLQAVTWDSRKGVGGADAVEPARIFLFDVEAIDRGAFADTPQGAEALCVAYVAASVRPTDLFVTDAPSLRFRVPSFMGARAVEKVFKVLCYYEADVHVLLNGFRLLQERLRRDDRYGSSWLFRL